MFILKLDPWSSHFKRGSTAELQEVNKCLPFKLIMMFIMFNKNTMLIYANLKLRSH